MTQEVGLGVLGWVCTVLPVILRGLSSRGLSLVGCFPLCPGEGEAAVPSRASRDLGFPGLPVSLLKIDVSFV